MKGPRSALIGFAGRKGRKRELEVDISYRRANIELRVLIAIDSIAEVDRAILDVCIVLE